MVIPQAILGLFDLDFEWNIFMLLAACLHYLSRQFGLVHICFLCLLDVFRRPTQIPTRHQEPLLV